MQQCLEQVFGLPLGLPLLGAQPLHSAHDLSELLLKRKRGQRYDKFREPAHTDAAPCLPKYRAGGCNERARRIEEPADVSWNGLPCVRTDLDTVSFVQRFR